MKKENSIITKIDRMKAGSNAGFFMRIPKYIGMHLKLYATENRIETKLKLVYPVCNFLKKCR